MRWVIGVALLLLAALLQITLVARISLLQGFADLVFLVMVSWMLQPGTKPDWKWGLPAGIMVGYASALPDWLMVIAYLAAAGLCQILSQRIWQGPLLTLLSSVLLGTFAMHLAILLYMFFSAHPMDAVEALNLITIPTILLNLIFILPVHAIISELNKIISPTEDPA